MTLDSVPVFVCTMVQFSCLYCLRALFISLVLRLHACVCYVWGSFAEALHSELEVSGVGVTCLMPGATRTGFEDNSGSTQALVWRLPLYAMEADEASRAVAIWLLLLLELALKALLGS